MIKPVSLISKVSDNLLPLSRVYFLQSVDTRKRTGEGDGKPLTLLTSPTNQTNRPPMKPYRLIETFSGKTVAKAETMEELREHITVNLADNYSIHHTFQGWFAPATILFKEESQQAAG